MYKYRQFLKILLSASSVLCLASVTVQAQNQPEPTKKQRSGSALERILSLFRAPENSLITRGDVCFISPGNIGEQTIWSDRPVFILHGTIPQAQIDLYDSTKNYNYERDSKLIWTGDVSSDTKTLVYTGEQLKPGIFYDWTFNEFSKKDKPDIPKTFKLMPQSKREAIATELSAIETELQQPGTTAEELAIAKADYFVNRQLWSDALQQLYSVENPSPDLTTKIADITQYLCESNN